MEQMTLFDNAIPQPLAARMRPQNLDEYVGQRHSSFLLKRNGLLLFF